MEDVQFGGIKIARLKNNFRWITRFVLYKRRDLRSSGLQGWRPKTFRRETSRTGVKEIVGRAGEFNKFKVTLFR